MLVQDFCPLKIKITQFPDGFHPNLFSDIKSFKSTSFFNRYKLKPT